MARGILEPEIDFWQNCYDTSLSCSRPKHVMSIPMEEGERERNSRVLQSSVETRMRSIQEKITLALTFCSTVEIEITHGHPDNAKSLLHKLRSTVDVLTDHVNNPAHVSGKRSKEFREQLVQLRKRLMRLESRLEVKWR